MPRAGDRPPILDSYARQSFVRKRQRERRGGRNMSLEGQHAVNLSRIEEYGATLGKKLQDEGKSAWDPTVIRKDWGILLNRVETHQSDGVCIFDIERFIRQVKDAVRIVELAEKGFIILDSDQEYDLMSPSGRGSFYNAAVAAEAYSHRLSVKVKRGLKLMHAEGEWLGGRYRMFGFERDSITLRMDEAAPVQRYAPRLLAGMTPQEVVDKFNSLGLLTTDGNEWNVTALRAYLTNPKIAGYIRSRGEIVGRLKGEARILEPNVWQAINAFYAARMGRPVSEAYLGTGIIRCGNCGTTGNGRKDGRNRAIGVYPDGTPTAGYECKRRAGGCGKTLGDARAIDEHLAAMVVMAISNPEHVDRIKRRVAETEGQRAPVLAEIGRLEELERHWGRRLNNGKISVETYETYTDDLASRVAEQRAKLESIAQAPPAPDRAEPLDEAWARWDRATQAERRALLTRTFAGYKIMVDPGSILDLDVRARIHVLPDA